MSKKVTPKNITIKDLYEECRRDTGYFKILINGKDNLEKILLEKGFVLSEKDCKSLKEKLGNEKMTDNAAKWLKAGLDWEGSREAERKRRKEAQGKAGGGGEKGPERDNCHWDDTV